MKVWEFASLYTEKGWVDKAQVVVDDAGRFVGWGKREARVEKVKGWAIPGFINAHSHAFQYAMVGKTENIPTGAKGDDFWSWRDQMYALANKISPSEMQKIATRLYQEMLANGYTKVVEFHYLHHDASGKPYKKISEMGTRLLAAAEAVGIEICLVPVFYQQSDFGQPAREEQKRFICKDTDQYFLLLENLKKDLKKFPNARLGTGVHSLRAARGEDVKAIFGSDLVSGPKHIHIAEQVKEVEACLTFYRQRPVQWLADNVDLSGQCNLVHATHSTPDEIRSIAKSGANVVLCPSTEGNLGDGIFPLHDYAAHKGSWCIGSDSQVCLDPFEELRWLDYVQRLQQKKRNVLCDQNFPESGEVVFRNARLSGDSAFTGAENKTKAFFRAGERFDVVVIDNDHPQLDVPKEHRLSALIYGNRATKQISGTIIGKKWAT